MNPQAIEQLIDTANVTQTGVIQWTGDNGLKNIVTYINENTVSFGVKTVDSLAQLATLSGNDANLVSVQQVGLYRFNPNASQAQPTSVAGVNGIWMLETSYAQTSSYSKVFGNGTDVTFDFQHNLNQQYPCISVWDISGVNPIKVLESTYDTYSLNANSIRLTFDTAPLLNTYLVNVQ